MRLNVYLQKAGIGSRREAERWIAEGLITINGKIAAVTDPVNDGDEVRVDGNLVTLDTKPLPRQLMIPKAAKRSMICPRLIHPTGKNHGRA